MQKAFIVLFVVAATVLFVSTYPTPGARLFAVNTLLEENAYESYYSDCVFDAERKRDWVRAEMSGTAPELRQEEQLTAYINELRRVRDDHAERFSEKYALYRRLGLIE